MFAGRLEILEGLPGLPTTIHALTEQWKRIAITLHTTMTNPEE
jgi:hypothetical protein